jgi:hypothetical protein
MDCLLYVGLGEVDVTALVSAVNVVAGSAAAATMAALPIKTLRREICVPSFRFS